MTPLVLGLLFSAISLAYGVFGVRQARESRDDLKALKAESAVQTDKLHDLDESLKALKGIIQERAREEGESPEEFAAEALHALRQARNPAADSASHYAASIGPFHPDYDMPDPEQADDSRIARLLLGHTYIGDPERDPWLRKWAARSKREHQDDERPNYRSTGDDDVFD